jgi:hypothetical protein
MMLTVVVAAAVLHDAVCSSIPLIIPPLQFLSSDVILNLSAPPLPPPPVAAAPVKPFVNIGPPAPTVVDSGAAVAHLNPDGR